MISGVLDLQDLTVRQIAIPMEKAVTVSLGTPMDEVLETARHRGFTRFPVWQGEGPDRRIIGVVSLKSLLYMQKIQPDEKAGQHLKPALYLPEDLRLEAALRRMQRSGQRLAIVLGRDRRELGIISLQDILRAIFGEVSL
jgi:CBS domain containing-hemolysin-like protein